jgi:hypothetical protein
VRIRIDDYPSGIRPIPSQTTLFHPLLRRIDSFETPYILGIVPAICSNEDWEFLRSLNNMVPAMHGITHKYFEYSPYLVSVGDPENRVSISRQFNELSGIHPKYLSSVLSVFKNKMESKLGLNVDIYIPPCNKITVRQSKALKVAGFRSIYSENRNPFLRLPNFKSDFYGRSNEFVEGGSLTTLHITWEYDVYLKWGFSSIDYLMGEISGDESRLQSLRESRRDWFLQTMEGNQRD